MEGNFTRGWHTSDKFKDITENNMKVEQAQNGKVGDAQDKMQKSEEKANISPKVFDTS